jgi:hypothetical protein
MEAVRTLKHVKTFTRLHSAISQKAVIFTLAALRTWYLAMHYKICPVGQRFSSNSSLKDNEPLNSEIVTA